MAVLPEPLPIPEGGLMTFSPDGTKIAYNPIFRNFRTWKRYTGGLAQAIAIYDLKNNTVEDVPHTEWTDTFPMWHGNTIYFTSDRGAEHRLESLQLRSERKADRATHPLHRLRRDVAEPGPGCHRLRERRLSLHLRSAIEASQRS